MTATGTLRAVPLFAQLRETDLDQLARLVRTRDHPKNSVILFAHDRCGAFYVLLAGEVKVTLIAEDGREVILSLIRNGDFFGETSLLDDEPQSATVIATEDSRLLVLHREDFRRCLTDMPGVALGLLRALCSRLREADDKIGGLILLDVPGRVSHLLLQLAARNDGEHIPNPPTHQVIAQMVGSSRETVSRTIRALALQGVIEVVRRRIAIRNRAALEIAAGRSRRGRAARKATYGGQERRRSGASPAPLGPAQG